MRLKMKEKPGLLYSMKINEKPGDSSLTDETEDER